MKILRITYEWPNPWSTLSPHPYEITSVQVKEGHTVEIFCGRWPKAGPIVEIPGVIFHPVWREPLKGTIAFTSSVILFFKYLKWRKHNTCDIIHGHGHFGIWIYWYRLLLKKFFPWATELKTPLVVHFHNTTKGREVILKEKGQVPSLNSKLLQWPLEELSDRMAVKTASAMIFVSQDVKDEAIKYYLADSNRCFLVETGVNTEMFKPVGQEEREKTRRELGFDIYDKVIVNHGMMVERKNIHLLVESLKYLSKNIKLLLVGPADKEYWKKITEMLDDLKLKDRVIYSGWAPYPEMAIALQASDIYVLPSKWEGLPKSVMESLACGLPTIVSGFKLSEDIKGLYYLDDISAEGIAAKVKEVIEKPQQVDVAKISHYYSWHTRITKIDEVYDFAKKNILI